MERTVWQADAPAFTWVDVVDPSRDELAALAARYGLHPTSVQDCLDPAHLPKYETLGAYTFMIVRAWDERAPHSAVSYQAATRKLALFCGPGFLLTVHRTDQPYLVAVRDRWAEGAALRSGEPLTGNGGAAHVPRMLLDLFHGVVDTFEAPLQEAGQKAEEFEGTIFDRTDIVALLREVYVVKRRVLLIRRMLWHLRNVLQRLVPAEESAAPLLRDLVEDADHLYSYSYALIEEIDSLLNIHLAVASNRTNDVMRVLTVFSAFFLPLTFIVGVYGMNFRHMPELDWRWGYAAVWGVMVATALGIFLWFRRRGWLRD
ncbi:MAG TPA: CorA family divalent cation transporter [Gemmatimonadales bacterium]|nr:CorA family divalent cation transporter [Gemmatimonadales bacterium]